MGKFLEDVETLIGTKEAKGSTDQLQDLHAKYKYIESGLQALQGNLKAKLPDIESALELVKFLKRSATTN